MQKIGFIIVSSLLLSACSLFPGKAENQYLQSQNGPNLVVPPPLTDSNVSHFYNLPPQPQDARVSIKPPPR